MVASYFIGQRYYFIRYDMKRILGYVFLAVVFYLISNLLLNHTMALRMSLNTLLLLCFCTFVYMIEVKRSEVN